MSPNLIISAEMIDDLLYYSRTADADALRSTLDEASKTLAAPPHDILAAAIDADSGNNVLHMAAANGHTEIINLIISLTPVPATSTVPLSSSPAAPPALINLTNKNGNTPLHWAALNGHLEAVKVLVEAGADVTAKNAAGHEAAFEAEQAGKEAAASWLVNTGAEEEKMEVKEEEVEMEATNGEEGLDGRPNE